MAVAALTANVSAFTAANVAAAVVPTAAVAAAVLAPDILAAAPANAHAVALVGASLVAALCSSARSLPLRTPLLRSHTLQLSLRRPSLAHCSACFRSRRF